MPSPQKLGPTTVYATGWSATKLSRLRRFSHRPQEVVATEADAEAVRVAASTNDSTRFDALLHVGHQHGALDALLVHLVEQLAELTAREHRLRRP